MGSSTLPLPSVMLHAGVRQIAIEKWDLLFYTNNCVNYSVVNYRLCLGLFGVVAFLDISVTIPTIVSNEKPRETELAEHLVCLHWPGIHNTCLAWASSQLFSAGQRWEGNEVIEISQPSPHHRPASLQQPLLICCHSFPSTFIVIFTNNWLVFPLCLTLSLESSPCFTPT